MLAYARHGRPPNLPARIFRAHLTRNPLAFLTDIQAHENALTWEDACYNWIRPHKSLRVEVQNHPRHKWLLRPTVWQQA